MKVEVLIFLILLISCDQKDKKNDSDDKLVNGMSKEEWKRNYVDSMTKKITKDVLFDTIGLADGPVKVLKATLFKEDYSNYKSIRLTYKNVSGKKIEAIRFRWYGEDAFGEPADMGTSSFVEGFGSGFDDDPLQPGKAMTNSWSILSSRGKRVVLAWAYEVAFSDGTKWALSK